MIIVPLLKPYPFGVAKLTLTTRDVKIEYQWWGNKENNVNGTYRPGWIGGKDERGEPIIYYSTEKAHSSHQPYMGHVELPMQQKDIVLHSFELSGKQKLQKNILDVIDKDHRIWWSSKALTKRKIDDAHGKERVTKRAKMVSAENPTGDTAQAQPKHNVEHRYNTRLKENTK